MKTNPFNWQQHPHYSGYRAEMPNDITLVVSPDRIHPIVNKPARGTTWHAQASQWDEATSTMSRFGRDEYAIKHKTYKEAMRAAEAIYIAEIDKN